MFFTYDRTGEGTDGKQVCEGAEDSHTGGVPKKCEKKFIGTNQGKLALV